MKHRYYLSIVLLVIIYSFDQLHGAAANGINEALSEESNRFRFVASLAYNNNKQNPAQNHFCSGTLITEKSILTSVRCATQCANNKCIIRLGSHDLLKCTTYNFKDFKTSGNLGIIGLNTIVKSISPAAVLFDRREMPYGSLVHAAAWNLNKNTLNQQAKGFILKHLSFEVLTRSACEKILQRCIPSLPVYAVINTICTKNYIKNGDSILMEGDEGGPLYDQKHRVVGVNFFSSPSCGPNGQSAVPISFHSAVFYEESFLNSSFRHD